MVTQVEHEQVLDVSRGNRLKSGLGALQMGRGVTGTSSITAL